MIFVILHRLLQRINVDIIFVALSRPNIFADLQEIEVESGINHNETSDFPIVGDIILCSYQS